MIRLRTVDVWDTLLRRHCHPDAVKLHVAGWLLARHWNDIRVELRSPRALLAARLRSEREIARATQMDPACDDEYTWRAVLEHWVGLAFEAESQRDALIQNLEAEELAQERRVGYADPGIRACLARTPQAETIFLSDFFMPATQVQALIDTQGLRDLVQGGVCSCDLRLNKRSGRLFQIVQQRYGITPKEHLHLGDNRKTDVQVPRRLGMVTRHYRNRQEARACSFNRKVFDDRIHLARALTVRAMKTLEMPRQGNARTAYRFGIQSAPLYVGFGLYLLEEASRHRHTHMYFLSREGAFFAEIYSVLRDAGASPGSRAPEARHIDISRRASFSASLKEPSIEEMQRVWRGYEPVTLRAWALSLDLDETRVEHWCRAHGLHLDEPISAPAHEPRILKMLSDVNCRHAVGAHIDERATLLRDYLAQLGLDGSSPEAAVVDIGWRGTIQDNLALALPRVRFHGYYLGLQPFLNPQPPNTSKQSYGPDLNRARGDPKLFGRLPLMEMLCTPPQGGVIRYQRKADGTVFPQRTEDEDHSRPAWRDAFGSFQAGVLHALPIWADAVQRHAVDSTELRDGALECWRRIILRAPQVIYRAQALLGHDERFGRGRHGPLAERDSSLLRFFQ